MIAEPWFWRDRGFAATAVAIGLAPAAALYDAVQKWTAARSQPYTAALPVICVGNATVGGVGKTPFALWLAEALTGRGFSPMFLTRGYGGREHGPRRVDPATDDAAGVGDEALLLAARAPTVVARNRSAGARMLEATDADVIVMDDGFQNPSLVKTCSILMIDAADPDGNGRIFPAGPLREPLERAAQRADAVVFMGGATPPDSLRGLAQPTFRGWMAPVTPTGEGTYIAFCGIGQPRRFFELLRASGATVAGEVAFPDHHRYLEAELARLRAMAARRSARLITTSKDYARLAMDAREGVDVFEVALQLDQADALLALIASKCALTCKPE